MSRYEKGNIEYRNQIKHFLLTLISTLFRPANTNRSRNVFEIYPMIGFIPDSLILMAIARFRANWNSLPNVEPFHIMWLFNNSLMLNNIFYDIIMLFTALKKRFFIISIKLNGGGKKWRAARLYLFDFVAAIVWNWFLWQIN